VATILIIFLNPW